MREQKSIPVSKVHRASRFVKTGVKVGGNYLKYYTKKALNQDADKESLDKANADEIYHSLSTLKGSALKAAQMLSMDQSILPRAYADKFQLGLYSAPPLSYPLVARTFQKYLGKRPLEIFDEFSKNAVNAASIGQVHKASIGEKEFAVKVQYPGVADSVSNDLRIAKPLAARIINIKSKDLDYYMEEVESRLLEETDYTLELERSMGLSENCCHIKNVHFPKYYPEYSSSRIITMDWIEGQHIDEWLLSSPSQEDRNRVGQALWNFYNYQVHTLKKFHADPHPGNFIISSSGELNIIDFGCVKEIPVDFYNDYIQLLLSDVLEDDKELTELFEQLSFFHATDTADQRIMIKSVLIEMIELLSRPFKYDTFDFGDKEYFARIYKMADSLMRNKALRKANAARGSRHGIYLNRTYFGLYSILHKLKAEIHIGANIPSEYQQENTGSPVA